MWSFGGFVRYLGYDIGGLELWPGRHVIAHLFWQVLSPPPDDYTIYIHLRDQDDNLIAAWDGPVARGDNGYYSSLGLAAGRIHQRRARVSPAGWRRSGWDRLSDRHRDVQQQHAGTRCR